MQHSVYSYFGVEGVREETRRHTEDACGALRGEIIVLLLALKEQDTAVERFLDHLEEKRLPRDLWSENGVAA